jgi:hypothetical protein
MPANTHDADAGPATMPATMPAASAAAQNASCILGFRQTSPRKVVSVGARGFEPPAFRSRTERATRLRHAPIFRCQQGVQAEAQAPFPAAKVAKVITNEFRRHKKVHGLRVAAQDVSINRGPSPAERKPAREARRARIARAMKRGETKRAGCAAGLVTGAIARHVFRSSVLVVLSLGRERDFVLGLFRRGGNARS